MNEERPRHVAAADVEPGTALWNPYGGRDGGFFRAASRARPTPDGNVEIDTEHGMTPRFRPGFQLVIDSPAMDRRAAEEASEARLGKDLEAG